MTCRTKEERTDILMQKHKIEERAHPIPAKEIPSAWEGAEISTETHERDAIQAPLQVEAQDNRLRFTCIISRLNAIFACIQNAISVQREWSNGINNKGFHLLVMSLNGTHQI